MSIWSDALFADATSVQIREFLARVFSVNDVASVEIRRAEGFGRIHYAEAGRPDLIWRNISRAVRGASRIADPTVGGASHPAEALFLDGPSSLPIEIARVGASLSSWRVRHASARRMRLAHPILRKRPDVAFRLEESLMSVLGVQSCRTSTVSGSVAIRFDEALISPERLLRTLEQFWPALLSGLDGPPSKTRLVAASGLFGLSAASRFLAPALKPFALVGVAIYGFPNVTMAVRQGLRGQVGLPALYAFGLALMLASGSPFNSTLFAVLMQTWPGLAHGTLSRSQRRLFAAHRRQATWARLERGGADEVEVDVGDLRSGDVVSIRKGDIVPIDGRVVDGLAAIDEETLSGVAGAVDKAPGDPVYATSYVRDGQLRVRVGEAGASTIAHEVARFLPRSAIADLPSALDAERIANRNAKPALALGVASLFARQLVRPSQAIIRPDYITAHRLGAQLAALHDLGDALHQGILFRRPAALDLLAATDVYVFDESLALLQRRIAIADILRTKDIPADDVLRHAAAAFPDMQNERARALQDRCADLGLELPKVHRRRRFAGAIAYDDEDGRHFEIASAALVPLSGVPVDLKRSIEASRYARAFDPEHWPAEHLLRPLVVRRDGHVIGVLTFDRTGAFEATEIIANLRAINRRARFVHVSSRPQAEAASAVRDLGIDTVVGDLDPVAKAHVLRDLGPRTMWIGDGASRDAHPAIGAANVSISVGGFSTLIDDQADIILLRASLQNLLPLRRIARAHRVRMENDYRAIYGVNLLGVAGGVFSTFGGLQAGLISNAGTAYVYWQHRRRLGRLIAHLESRRALLATPGREDGGQLTAPRLTDAEAYVDHRPTAGGQPIEKAEGV